ncbi:unnamed protein product [Ixodes pacificus]
MTSSRLHVGFCSPHSMSLTSSGLKAPSFSMGNTLQKPAAAENEMPIKSDAPLKASICLRMPVWRQKSASSSVYSSMFSRVTSSCSPPLLSSTASNPYTLDDGQNWNAHPRSSMRAGTPVPSWVGKARLCSCRTRSSWLNELSPMMRCFWAESSRSCCRKRAWCGFT